MSHHPPSARRMIGGALGAVLVVALIGVLVARRSPWVVDLFPPPSTPPTKAEDPTALEALMGSRRPLIVVLEPGVAEVQIGSTLVQLGDSGAEACLVMVTNGREGDAPMFWKAGKLVYLGYRPGEIDPADLRATLGEIVERHEPDALICPDPEFGPVVMARDGALVAEVCADLPPIGEYRFYLATRSPNVFVDAEAGWESKAEMLKPTGVDLEKVRAEAEERGRAVGLRLAEGLRAVPQVAEPGTAP